MANIFKLHFEMYFKFVFKGFLLKCISTDSCNDFVLNRQQTITWTNDDTVFYASI